VLQLLKAQREEVITISGSIDNMLSFLLSSKQELNSILTPVGLHAS
jgi:hypothetical protein